MVAVTGGMVAKAVAGGMTAHAVTGHLGCDWLGLDLEKSFIIFDSVHYHGLALGLDGPGGAVGSGLGLAARLALGAALLHDALERLHLGARNVELLLAQLTLALIRGLGAKSLFLMVVVVLVLVLGPGARAVGLVLRAQQVVQDVNYSRYVPLRLTVSVL